jgi:hypothetical protein
VKNLLLLLAALILSLAFLFSCTKDKGTNPELPFDDQSLLDSAKNSNYYYYKSKKDTIYSGSHGSHGTFKLRFNSKAFVALTDSGRLPKGKKFAEGSFIVKDVYKNGNLYLYAYMFKRNGKWLWGEVEPSGNFHFKIKDGEKTCLGCHSQTGHRDNAVVFHFY